MGSESLRREVLMTIKSLQPSLIQMKHGQKVIAKLQKTYPQIFLSQNCHLPFQQKQSGNVKKQARNGNQGFLK